MKIDRRRLIVDIPLLQRVVYVFHPKSRQVFIEGAKRPVNEGLAGYLWLLKERKFIMRKAEKKCIAMNENEQKCNENN
jgi:hypothetical protein